MSGGSSDAQRRRRWRAWIRRLEPEIGTLVISRILYHQLQEELLSHPLSQTRGDFYSFIGYNFVVATSVAIRKQTDRDRRSLSLVVLLEDIAAHPSAITRRSHRIWYPSASGRRHAQEARQLADVVFDALAGRGHETLPRVRVTRELRELRQADRSIRTYVNKRVAHLDRSNRRRTLPKFEEFDVALQLIERLFMNYRRLLFGQDQGSEMQVFSVGLGSD